MRAQLVLTNYDVSFALLLFTLTIKFHHSNRHYTPLCSSTAMKLILSGLGSLEWSTSTLSSGLSCANTQTFETNVSVFGVSLSSFSVPFSVVHLHNQHFPVRGLGSPVWQWCEPASVMRRKSVPQLIMNWTKLISLKETSYNIKVSQQNK